MADFGLRVKNNANQIQVDSTFKNVNIVARGVANQRTWIPYPASAAECMVFLKLPPNVQMQGPTVPNDSAIYGLIDEAATNPANGFGFTGRFFGSGYTNVGPLEYAIATAGPPQSPPPGSYGMRVRDAAGQLCFNSLYNQPQIVGITSGTLGAYGNVPFLDLYMPDNSQNFWVSVPMGGLLADGWYDGTQEFIDVQSIGMGWLNTNTIRIITNVQTFYPIGFGQRQVTHQDCYGATVSALAARII